MAEIISFRKTKKKSNPAPSKKIIDAVEKYFVNKKYDYTPVDENGIIRTGFSLDNRLKHADVIISITNNGVLMRFVILIGAGRDREDLLRTAEFLARANYGMRRGCFELNFNDGEIFFRTSVFGDDNFIPTQNEIDDLISIGISVLDIYGDPLINVIFNVQKPEEAICDAEK